MKKIIQNKLHINYYIMSCPICFNTLNLPIKMECCKNEIDYLCIKSILLSSTTSNNCPMCRTPISQVLLDNIKLSANHLKLLDNYKYQWYFAGKNFGWWKYDPESNKQINIAYDNYLNNNNNSIINISISPVIDIIINFNTMIQTNKSTNQTRKIKKELKNSKSSSIKGIAGIQTHKL